MPTKQVIGGKSLPSKPGPSPQSSRNDEDEQNSGGKRSKADLFNNAKPAQGFGVPPGNYTAHLVNLEHIKDDNSEKESIKITLEVADEGEFEGKPITSFYSLFDKDGNLSKGLDFFKRDMALLGQPDVEYDQLAEQLEATAAERLHVNIQVKQNGQYTNTYIQGLVE